MANTAQITVHTSSKDIKSNWFIIDASGATLGKISTIVAGILMGKHKTNFTKHMNDGDKVIIVNAKKVVLTGKKWENKKYYHHTGYTGNLKEITYERLLEKKPTFILEKAIKGMLPKTKLGSKYYSNLFVYSDEKHPHQAQKPQSKKI